MNVLGLIWFFGLYSSVKSQLTIPEIRNVMKELVQEGSSHSEESENRLLWEEVVSLRRTQSRMEADLKDMQTKIKELSGKNACPKQNIDEPNEENLELKGSAIDNVDGDVAVSDHSEETVRPARAKSLRFLVNSVVLAPTPIAFSARLTHNINNPQNNDIFLFDYLVINSGNAYNRKNGMFTAPLKGIYAFFSSILTSAGKYIEVMIVRNGVNFCNVFSGDMDFWGPGFNMAITELEVGDAVWVKVHGQFHATGTTINGGWTTFSGFLLYETE